MKKIDKLIRIIFIITFLAVIFAHISGWVFGVIHAKNYIKPVKVDMFQYIKLTDGWHRVSFSTYTVVKTDGI